MKLNSLMPSDAYILTIIGSDNGLSPNRRQAIIWTNAGILLIRPSGTNFSEILIEIGVFSFKKVHLKMSSAKCRPFCLGLNVLIVLHCPSIACQAMPSHYLKQCWHVHRRIHASLGLNGLNQLVISIEISTTTHFGALNFMKTGFYKDVTKIAKQMLAMSKMKHSTAYYDHRF